MVEPSGKTFKIRVPRWPENALLRVFVANRVQKEFLLSSSSYGLGALSCNRDRTPPWVADNGTARRYSGQLRNK